MHLLPRPLFGHRPTRTSSSTLEVNEDKEAPGGRCQSRSHGRSVQFADQHEIHVFEGVSQGERALVWFTPQEISRFHQAVLTQAALLRAEHAEHKLGALSDSWCEAILRVYRVCRGPCSKQEFMLILASATGDSVKDKDALGLHDAAVPVISNDFLVRRRHVMGQFKRIQSLQMPDEERAGLLNEASCLVSNVARSFAVYLAFVNAQDVANDNDS